MYLLKYANLYAIPCMGFHCHEAAGNLEKEDWNNSTNNFLLFFFPQYFL